MSDPMKDLDELEAINDRREAAGLPATSSVAEARQWAADNGGDAGVKAEEAAKAQDKPETVEPAKVDGEQKAAVTAEKVLAPPPVVPKAEAPRPSDGGRVAELEKEIQRLKSEQGRSTVLANELRDLKAERDAALERAANAEKAAEDVARKARGGGLRSFLTPEQLENADPSVLEAIDRAREEDRKAILEAVRSEVAGTRSIVEEQQVAAQQRALAEAQERADRMWAEKVNTVIPPGVYGAFGTNPKWAEWNGQTTAGIPNADLYQRALQSADHKAVIMLFRDFMEYANIEVPAKGSKPPFKTSGTGGMTEPGTLLPSKDGKPTYNDEEIRAVEDFYLRRKGPQPSGWTYDRFSKITDEWDDARAEGRVLDRNGNPVRE